MVKGQGKMKCKLKMYVPHTHNIKWMSNSYVLLYVI